LKEEDAGREKKEGKEGKFFNPFLGEGRGAAFSS